LLFVAEKRRYLMRERGSGVTPPRVVEFLKHAVSNTSMLAVSKATGIGLAAIGRYLKGIGEPTQKSLQKLSDYFGVSVAYLRGEEEISIAELVQMWKKTNSLMLTMALLLLENGHYEPYHEFIDGAIAIATGLVNADYEEADEAYKEELSKIKAMAEDFLGKAEAYGCAGCPVGVRLREHEKKD